MAVKAFPARAGHAGGAREEKVREARATLARALPDRPGDRAGGVSAPVRLDRGRVLSVHALGGIGRRRAARGPSRRGRGLPAHRGPAQLQAPAGHRPGARVPSGGAVHLHGRRGHRAAPEEGLLQLDVPGGDPGRSPVEAGPARAGAEPGPAALGRLAAAFGEVPAPGILPVGRLAHGRAHAGGVPGQPLQRRGGHPHVSLLRPPLGPGRGGAAGVGRAVGAGAELLVPLPLPLRRAAGAAEPGQPAAHHPRRGHLHRLHALHQGLPGAHPGAPGRPGGQRRVHRLLPLRAGLPGEGHPADAGAHWEGQFRAGCSGCWRGGCSWR